MKGNFTRINNMLLKKESDQNEKFFVQNEAWIINFWLFFKMRSGDDYHDFPLDSSWFVSLWPTQKMQKNPEWYHSCHKSSVRKQCLGMYPQKSVNKWNQVLLIRFKDLRFQFISTHFQTRISFSLPCDNLSVSQFVSFTVYATVNTTQFDHPDKWVQFQMDFRRIVILQFWPSF